MAHMLARDLEQCVKDSEDSLNDIHRLTMIDPTTLKTNNAVRAFTLDVEKNVISRNEHMCGEGEARIDRIREELLKVI